MGSAAGIASPPIISPSDDTALTTANARAAYHNAAVAQIVSMIRDKYASDGERNLAIGQRAFEHAQWLRFNTPEYNSQDFDALMNRIRDDVRSFIPIKPSSIRIADWIRTYVLRMLVSEAKGEDLAGKLSFFEYRALSNKALSFSKNDVEGLLVEGWLDFIADVAVDRMRGKHVSADEFIGGMRAHAQRIALGRATRSAGSLPSESEAKRRAVAKAMKSLTTKLADTFSNGLLPIEAVLGIVENVARKHGVAVPTTLGFDPATCTDDDCDHLAATMFESGHYDEMVRLRDRLNHMVSSADKTRAASYGLASRLALRTA